MYSGILFMIIVILNSHRIIASMGIKVQDRNKTPTVTNNYIASIFSSEIPSKKHGISFQNYVAKRSLMHKKCKSEYFVVSEKDTTTLKSSI